MIVTWAKSHSSTDDVSLMGVKFVDEKEVWLLGSASVKRSVYGQFYRSSNGGKSFELVQVHYLDILLLWIIIFILLLLF